MDTFEGSNITGDLGTRDRNCAAAKSDIASRIVLVMEACRLMQEEAAVVTGFEPDQMRGISRGRFDSVSVDELQAALEALEVWENEVLRQYRFVTLADDLIMRGSDRRATCGEYLHSALMT